MWSSEVRLTGGSFVRKVNHGHCGSDAGVKRVGSFFLGRNALVVWKGGTFVQNLHSLYYRLRHACDPTTLEHLPDTTSTPVPVEAKQRNELIFVFSVDNYLNKRL